MSLLLTKRDDLFLTISNKSKKRNSTIVHNAKIRDYNARELPIGRFDKQSRRYYEGTVQYRRFSVILIFHQGNYKMFTAQIKTSRARILERYVSGRWYSFNSWFKSNNLKIAHSGYHRLVFIRVHDRGPIVLFSKMGGKRAETWRVNWIFPIWRHDPSQGNGSTLSNDSRSPWPIWSRTWDLRS